MPNTPLPFSHAGTRFTADGALAALMGILLVVVPLLYFANIRDYSSLPRYALLGVATTLGLGVWALGRARLPRTAVWWPSLFVPITLLLLWAGASAAWSVDPDNTAIELLQLLTFAIVAFIGAQLAHQPLRTLVWVFAAAVGGGALASGIGLMQYYGYNPGGYVQFSAPASTFTNKNFAALYLDLIPAIAVSLILIAETRIGRWLSALGLGLCLCFLVISRTRGSWLGLIMAIVGLLLALLCKPALRAMLLTAAKKVWRPLLAAVLIPVVVLAVPTSHGRGDYKIKAIVTGAPDLSIETRIDAYRNALYMLRENPIFGTGFGGFRLGFRPNMFKVAPTPMATEDNVMARLHSDPLQLFVELGIPGGLLGLLIYLWAIVLAWRLTDNAQDPVFRWLGLGLFLALVASGAHACVDFPLRKPTSAFVFWLFLGIVAGLDQKQGNKQGYVLRRSALTACAVVGLALGAYAVGFYSKYVISSHDLLVAERAYNTNDCRTARRAIDQGMRTFGLDYGSQMEFVSVYSFCDIPDSTKLTAMNQALAYDPTNTRALLTRGNLYLRSGRLAEAAKDFNAVVQLLPDRASGFVGLGRTLLARGELSSARQFLGWALQADPRNGEAKNLLDTLNSTVPPPQDPGH